MQWPTSRDFMHCVTLSIIINIEKKNTFYMYWNKNECKCILCYGHLIICISYTCEKKHLWTNANRLPILTNLNQNRILYLFFTFKRIKYGYLLIDKLYYILIFPLFKPHCNYIARLIIMFTNFTIKLGIYSILFYIYTTIYKRAMNVKIHFSKPKIGIFY